ncbi:hypothetical protein AVL62_15115 [Serinicoccus chungangensis]|uniref:Uncharacterized protein n=1 Tax=Serinicoccus chungangensis TaxID=767452 RepID=A0A0W8IBP1_9MICO|nr:hypothetical protein AVL62_15115 [Serinicoccus chungangensis]
MVLMRETHVVWIIFDALDFAGKTGGLQTHGRLEIFRLEAATLLVAVGRVRPVDRVAQHHHDLDARKVICDALVR